MNIEFSLFSLMGYRDRGTNVGSVVSDTVSLVQHAEEVGFDAAWFAEHHFSNYCVSPSPLIMVSHCVGVTSKIRLGPAVLVIPLYQPIRLIEEIGLISELCGERFMLGIGSGYQPFEFDRFDKNLSHSKAEFDEFINLMDSAFENETFSYDGVFTKVPETSISTRPFRKAPIWIAGDSEETHKLAARQGFTPIITGRWSGPEYLASMRSRIDSSYVAEGFSKGAESLGILRFACVTKDDEETESYLENARYQLRLAMSLRNRSEAMNSGMMVERPVSNEPTLKQIEKNLAIGDVQTVAARLLDDIRASGANHIMLNIQAGSSTLDQAKRTMDALPKIRAAIADGLG